MELFFEFQYGVEVGIYVMHEEWDGELLIGNRNTHKRDLHLKNGTEHLDYVVEKKCMESNNFEVGNGIVGNGGKGAIRIDTMDGKTYILSFGNIASDSKKIFHIQQGFEKGGFEQIIKTKLEHINKIYKDALTKLYNREYFNQVAQLHSYSFLFIDINNFKLVNDNF